MLNQLIAAASSYGFPVPSNIGDLHQILPDNTREIIKFGGSGFAPGSSSLQIQVSNGNTGPWTLIDTLTFNLSSGLPIVNYPYSPSGYAKTNYYRARWVNASLGYTGPYFIFAGPTVKERWNVATVPIAPTAITAIATVNPGFGFQSSINVTVTHSLANSANFSDIGIYVTATGVQNGNLLTYGAYFSTGWGSSVGASQIYNVPFTDSTSFPITLATAASARYFVLGDPLPGILGATVNYP